MFGYGFCQKFSPLRFIAGCVSISTSPLTVHWHDRRISLSWPIVENIRKSVSFLPARSTTNEQGIPPCPAAFMKAASVSSDSQKATALADLFCRNASRKVQRLFRDLWRNDDDRKNAVTARVMDGEFSWLEEGRLDVGLSPESFKTRFLTQETEEPRKAAGL